MSLRPLLLQVSMTLSADLKRAGPNAPQALKNEYAGLREQIAKLNRDPQQLAKLEAWAGDLIELDELDPEQLRAVLPFWFAGDAAHFARDELDTLWPPKSYGFAIPEHIRMHEASEIAGLRAEHARDLTDTDESERLRYPA